jgi:acetyl-CoA acetyltransferase
LAWQSGRGPLDYVPMEAVTPNEIAKWLGVNSLRFRRCLRAGHDAGHPLVAGHDYRARCRFTRAEADQFAVEFRSVAAPARPALIYAEIVES